MAKGVLDTVEFAPTNAQDPDIALATGTVYAIVVEGPDNDIWVETVSIDSSGVITDLNKHLEIDSGTCRVPKIIQLADGYLAIVYQGSGDDGFIATISVDGSGNIAIIDSWEFDTGRGYAPFIVNISGTTYAIAYSGGSPASPSALIKTLTISNTGTITKSWIDTLGYGTAGLEPQVINISGDIWVIIYRATGSTGRLTTVDIDSSGNIGVAAIATYTISASAWNGRIIHISGTMYAFVYRDTADGVLDTIDIQNDGTIAGAITDTLTYESSAGFEPNIGLYDTNVFLITYHATSSGGNLKAKTIAIADNGTIGAVADTATIATYSFNQRHLETATSKIWIIVSQGLGNDGWIYTMGVLPTVTTQAVRSAGSITATFHGNCTSLGIPNPIEHGFVYGTSANPTINNNKKDLGALSSTGAYSADIIGLPPGTTIYVRAYAKNGDTAVYGNQVQFMTTGAVAPGLYAKFWVWVDWNDDGDFADDYETITSDVLEIPSIVYGKNRELEQVVSASLQLIVDNYDHKYSPPNASSVLNQGGRTLRPGHKVMMGASFPWDEFADTDGVTLANHTVMWDSTYLWVEESGTFVIDTNAVKETGGGGIAVLDFEEPNAHVQVKFKKGADNDCILVLRFSDTDNYLYVKTTATDLELRKVDGGVDTLLDGETFAWAVGDTKVVKVVLHNEFIWVIVDLTQRIPATRRVTGALLSSTFNETETKHGIGGPIIHADARYEEFGGVYSLFNGTIDRIVPTPNKERQTAYIEASDDLKILARTKFYRRAYAYAGYPAGMKAYLEEILEQLPTYSGRGELLDFGENVNTNPYKSWWDVSALDVCRDIEREENGFFYQDQDGIWRFEEKDHRTTSPHAASICTIYDIYATNGLAFANLKWDSGEDDVRNLVSVHVEKSILDNDTKIGAAGTDGAIIWRCKEADVVDDPDVSSSDLSIPASGEKVIYFEAKYFDTVTDLINPTVTPDVYKIEGKILDGPFKVGETVTGDVSGNTGEVMEAYSDYILLGNCSGAFNVADSFTGATSLAFIQGGASTYIVKGTITNGPFVRGEGITTDVSGITAIVQVPSSIGLILVQCSGAPNAGDTFTGVDSGASLNGGATLIGQYNVTITLMKDYMANAAANGGGADKTGNLTVTLAYPFYNSYGKGGKLTLANNDGSTIYVTRLLVRGRGYKLQDRGSVLVEDSTSQSDYGEHSINIDAKVLTNLAEAQTLAADIESKEDTPRAKVIIEMKRGTKENLIKMLSLKLSDRITLNYSDMGINEDFYINKMEYRLLEGGLNLACALTLEEVA